MYTIFTLNKISDVGLANLDATYTVQDTMEGADAVLVRSAKMHEMVLPSSVKAIARAGAGVNNIPIDTYAEAGVVVFNTPGANANAVKELVIAGLLMSSRKIVQGVTWAKTLTEDVAKQVEGGKGAYIGPELFGKKLGVVGLGAIGVMVANAAQSLGMQVIGYDPYISVDAAWGLSSHIQHARSLEEVLGEADYVTIHVPLLPATKHMFNEQLFQKVKPGVRLLNFSRDTLVDNVALKAAIEKGIVANYVTDFPVEEVQGNEAILCIPHLGASTPESEDNCAMMAVQQVKHYLEQGNIVNAVNFPQCEMAWNTQYRLAIIHQNIPAVIGKITSAIADAGINISDMINKSKNKIAYTLIDLNVPISEKVLDEMRQMDDITSIRVLQK